MEKIKQFIKKNKTELVLGTISVVSIIFAVRAYNRLDKVDDGLRQIDEGIEDGLRQIDERIKDRLRMMESTFYALTKIHPVISIDNISEIGLWRSALKKQGIMTVGDLIREVRSHNGTKFLMNFPGIGNEGYFAIYSFLKKNATDAFKKLYL